jgi:hypothetical protein
MIVIVRSASDAGRVEMKAKKLKITPAEVVKKEAADKAKRLVERFKR